MGFLFFLASPLDNPMLFLLRWEYVGIHLDSLFALFFFLPNMDLGSKTTSVEMNDSVCVTFSDNFR